MSFTALKMMSVPVKPVVSNLAFPNIAEGVISAPEGSPLTSPFNGGKLIFGMLIPPPPGKTPGLNPGTPIGIE